MNNDEAMPEPPVPADIDVQGMRGFILDVDKLLASELWALCSGDEAKAAVSLWCRAWRQTPPGSLPDDDRVLAAFSGAGARWKKVRQMALRGFVKCSDGRLYHTLICENAAQTAEKRRAFQERTAAATEARRRKAQRNDDRDGQRNDDRNDERNDERNDDAKGQRNDHHGDGDGDGDGKYSPCGPPDGGPPPCPQQAIVNAYHDELPTLPRVRVVSDTTAAALRRRWREDVERQTLDWWRAYFAYVRDECPFLVGKCDPGPNRTAPFLADFAWLVGPKNFEKVCNGRYEEKARVG